MRSIAKESHLLDHEDSQQEPPHQARRVLMYTSDNEVPTGGLYHRPRPAPKTPLVPLKRLPNQVELLKAALSDQAASVEEMWVKVGRRIECMEASQSKLTELLTQLEYENRSLKEKVARLEHPVQEAHQLLKDECAKTVKEVDFTCQIGMYLARAGIRKEYENAESKLNRLAGTKLVDDLAQSLNEVSVKVQEESSACKNDVERNYNVLAKLMCSFDSYVTTHDRHQRRRDRELSEVRASDAYLREQVKELRQQIDGLLQATEIEKERAVEILK